MPDPETTTTETTTTQTEAPKIVKATEERVPSQYEVQARREAETARREAADAKSRVDALEAAESERQRKALEDSKEFEKLANHEKAKREEAEHALATERTTNAARAKRSQLETLAAKAGILDLDDVSKIDLSGLSVDAEGRLIGADDAVEDLKKRKPHYFKLDGKPAKARSDAPPGPGKTPAAADVADVSGLDAYALTDAEFERRYSTLGRIARA